MVPLIGCIEMSVRLNASDWLQREERQIECISLFTEITKTARGMPLIFYSKYSLMIG